MQMTREEYLALADHVIENDGDLEELREKVQELLVDELGQRGIPCPRICSIGEVRR